MKREAERGKTVGSYAEDKRDDDKGNVETKEKDDVEAKGGNDYFTQGDRVFGYFYDGWYNATVNKVVHAPANNREPYVEVHWESEPTRSRLSLTCVVQVSGRNELNA